jgi:hypothetical protein
MSNYLYPRKTSESDYDYVKRRCPESFRRAVNIGSLVETSLQFNPQVRPGGDLAALVEKCVMEVLALTINEFSPLDREAKEVELKAQGFEEVTAEQRAWNRLVNFGHE